MERLPTTLKNNGGPEVGLWKAKNISLKERWRLMRKEKKTTGKESQFHKYGERVIVVFQIPTQIYAFLYYIIPYYLHDYDPWTMYYAKVLATYIGVMLLANWFGVILYGSTYEKTKDRPFLTLGHPSETVPDRFVARIQQATEHSAGQNGHCVYDMSSDEESLPWHFCDKCNMHVPFRVHHCSTCKKCIIKKDHHCFIVGTCIGFRNERYFIVMTFYTIIAGIVGGFITSKYIYDVVFVDLNSWLDLFFPVTVWHWSFGELSSFHCMVITHVYIEFLFGCVCFSFFVSQVSLNLRGKTLYEQNKKLPVRNTNSFNRNMKSVFGDFWGLNFLFPMTILFRQRDDGVTWDGVKLDQNSDKTKTLSDKNL